MRSQDVGVVVGAAGVNVDAVVTHEFRQAYQPTCFACLRCPTKWHHVLRRLLDLEASDERPQLGRGCRQFLRLCTYLLDAIAYLVAAGADLFSARALFFAAGLCAWNPRC